MIPFVGAALALGFAALAIARRDVRGRLMTRKQGPRFELDPLGPAEGASDALDLPQDLTPRSEAEALAGVGIAWPLMPPSPARDAPISASVPDRGEVPGRDRHELSSMPGAHALAPDELAIGQELMAAADFDEMDLDIDFDDDGLEEISTERELSADFMDRPLETREAYDAVLPEDLGTEWLARATEAPAIVDESIDDLAEIPASVQPLSEGSAQAAGYAEGSSRRARSLLADDDVPTDLWDAFERSRR